MSRPRAIQVLSAGAALTIVTIAAFLGLLSSGFIDFDDDAYVTANRHVQAGLTPASITWALTATEGANWHPLTWMSHMADVQVFGLDAGRHHLSSVLIHAANTVLLFFLLRRMTGALWRPAFAAGLFAIHPLHVESVAWIAERKDVLSTLFWLLTVFAWLRFLASRTAARYASVAILFALGLMAKPMLVTLPFTLLLLDVWPLKRLKRATLPPVVREKAALFAMSLASCVVTFVAQRSGGAVGSLVNFPFGVRLANAIVAYASYLAKTVWPVTLAVFYPYAQGGHAVWAVALIAACLGAATGLSLGLANRAPYVTFGWLWYLGTLLPVIGLVQIGSQSMADRYTYVPLIGIFVAAAWGLADLAGTSRAARYALSAAAVAILAASSFATRVQAAYWKDSTALFTHALAVTPDNWLAHANLGVALADQGKLEEAIAHQREALRIRPAYTEAHYNLGLALERTGHHAEAIDEFNSALRLRPGYAPAHNNLAGVLAGQGQTGAAIEHLEQAVRFDPENADARFNLAGLFVSEGRLEEAIEQYEAVLRLRPDDADVRANLERAREAARRRP